LSARNRNVVLVSLEKARNSADCWQSCPWHPGCYGLEPTEIDMDALDTRPKLCYVNAAQVGTPAGRLAYVTVCGRNGDRLGIVDGVLINPAERRICFLVVESERLDGTHRYLVSADDLIRMECDRGALRLEADADPSADCDVDLNSIPAMTEDDVIAAMFARRAA
jgi:hypothetical protein